jgi:hypothetical protein
MSSGARFERGTVLLGVNSGSSAIVRNLCLPKQHIEGEVFTLKWRERRLLNEVRWYQRVIKQDTFSTRCVCFIGHDGNVLDWLLNGKLYCWC